MTAITVPASIMRDDGTTFLEGQITFPDGTPGGAASPLWQLSGNIALAGDPSDLLGLISATAPFQADSLTYGQQAQSFGFPSYTYGVGATILTLADIALTLSAASTVDALNFGVFIVVANVAGTEVIGLGGQAQVVQGGTTATLDHTSYSTGTSTGVDLSFDNSTGVLTTTAGGIYAIAGIAIVSWN